MNRTGRDLYVDKMLTNLSIGYRNAKYIADDIFPIVPVMKQSGIVPEYEQSHWFRSEAKRRAPGTKSVGGGYNVKKTATYFCERYSYRDEIIDEDRDNVESPFELESESTEFVTDKIQMAREVGFSTDFFKTGVWGTDKTGATDFTQFSDYGASDPLGVISDYRDTIQGRIAVDPNTLVMGRQVFSKLKWHPDLIDLIKYTQRGQLTAELIASLLEFDRILIGNAIKTTDPEGTAEASVTYSRIWGKHILMLFVAAKASLRTPSAGYTFVWQRIASAIQFIKRMRDEEREVDIIEGNTYYDQKVTGAASGLFMSGAVA